MDPLIDRIRATPGLDQMFQRMQELCGDNTGARYQLTALGGYDAIASYGYRHHTAGLNDMLLKLNKYTRLNTYHRTAMRDDRVFHRVIGKEFFRRGAHGLNSFPVELPYERGVLDIYPCDGVSPTKNFMRTRHSPMLIQAVRNFLGKTTIWRRLW